MTIQGILTKAKISQKKWKFRHSLMLLWFADLMNVTEEVTIHRPNVSTLLSSVFIRGDCPSGCHVSFNIFEMGIV